MNLEESDLYKEQLEKELSNKRVVAAGIGVCIFFVILFIVLMMYISYKDKNTDKIYIDKVNSKAKIDYLAIPADKIKDELVDKYEWDEEDLPTYEKDPIYIDVKALSTALKYTYMVGEYKKYNEDNESATIQGKYEIVSFKSGTEYYQKYLNSDYIGDKDGIAGISGMTFKNDATKYVENYRFSSPPISDENGNIYVALADIPKMFNVQIDWSGEHWKYITTLEAIVKSTKLPAGYTSLSGYYENIRAMADGYIIVGTGNAGDKTTQYGVYKAKNIAEPFISAKYSDIEYQQNTGQFYLTNSDGKVGLAYDSGSEMAKVIVEAGEYTNISLLDDKQELYEIEKNNEYGVIQKQDEVVTIIDPEYQEIGYEYEDDFIYETENIGTKYLWFDKYIPVRKNGKVGLFKVGNPKDGSLNALAVRFEGFGYISDEEQVSGNKENLLTVPGETGVHGLVVYRNGAYGLYDLNTGKIALQCVYDNIYALTENGIRTYYCELNGEKYELSSYFSNIDGNGTSIKNVDKTGKFIGKRGNDEEGTSGGNEETDADKFNKELIAYEGDQSGSGVKKLLNNLAKNAENNSTDINRIPSLEYYTSESESEIIEPDINNNNNQETYVSDISEIIDNITSQSKFNVQFEYKNSGIVSKVIIKIKDDMADELPEN